VPIYESFLQTIGHTPVVRLRKFKVPGSADIYAKVESVNPGCSIKARTALSMIEDAERRGVLKSDSIIVEPTSGNQGIAISMIAAVKGYKVKICLPANMSMERRKVLQSYGAELVLTPIGKDIKETIELCLEKVIELKNADPRVFVPQQFENPANVAAHYNGTAEEILADFGTDLHAFVAGIGTGGTITGVGRKLKERIPGVRIVAVEPDQAPLLAGGKMGHHCQEGIGDGIMPGILDTSVIDTVYTVSDQEACDLARALARKEGLFTGVSSGTTLAGALRIAKELGEGKKVLCVVADGGEKYLSTRLCEF
jgi:cysteine synthase A